MSAKSAILVTLGIVLLQPAARAQDPVDASAHVPWAPKSPLANMVHAAGFNYDSDQDIIVSRMDAWQRNLGYCWGYDIAAPLISCIIDAEPLYFTYDGKDWMIELWKGQYGLECGGEIGIYNRKAFPFGKDMGVFACATDADRLEMKFSLFRKKELLITRGPETHWWLTGFRWGTFAEPEDLTMEVSIKLKDRAMRTEFQKALATCGYKKVAVSGNTVSFTFAKPFTTQPPTRQLWRKEIQANNQAFVASYDQAKKVAGLANNDPNGITQEACGKVFQAIVDWIKAGLGGTARKK